MRQATNNNNNNSIMAFHTIQQGLSSSSKQRPSVIVHLRSNTFLGVFVILLLLSSSFVSTTTTTTVDNNNNNNNECYICTKLRQNPSDPTHEHEQEHEPEIVVTYLPLIGIGIGNMQHDIISNRIASAIHDENINIRLIDTAHASSNEHLLRQGIDIAYQEIILQNQEQQEEENNNNNSELPISSSSLSSSSKIIDIHIITKVWYTHLGYNRTIVSVQESIHELHKTTLLLPKKEEESNLKIRIHVHVLLHWPRCRNDIEWMDCTKEENNLPSMIRQLGPNPNDNPNLFLESWKALEDIYYYKKQLLYKPVAEVSSSSPQPPSQKLRGGNHNHYYDNINHQPITSSSRSKNNKDDNLRSILNTIHDYSNDPFEIRIASIGVSNFDVNDLSLLLQHSRIPPHIVQDNVWTYIFHPQLVTLLQQHNIHYQAYNVMNGIISNYDHCPNTYHTLERIAIKLLFESNHHLAGNDQEEEEELVDEDHNIPEEISPTQFILSWLVHQNVSIIPRTSSSEHMYENSPQSLYPYIHIWNIVRNNNMEEYKTLSYYAQKSIGSLLRQVDLTMIEIIFDNSNVNAIRTTVWLLYWYNTDDHTDEDGSTTIFDHLHYVAKIHPGEIFRTGTHPEHTFIVIPYENDKSINNNSDSEHTEPILPTDVLEELVSKHNTTYTVSVEYGDEETFYLPIQPGLLSEEL